MIKNCEHANLDDDFRDIPEEDIENLKKGLCPGCEVKAKRRGSTWICGCCGVEWVVASRKILVSLTLEVPI